jgi:hypothetical protein
MYHIILSLLILTFVSCGKEKEADFQPIHKELRREKLKHYLPELQLNEISNIKIVFENRNLIKEFGSTLEAEPQKDYFRRKLIYQSMVNLQNAIDTKEMIKNEEYDLYNIDLYNLKERLTNKALIQNNEDLLDTGSLYFNLNLSFKNLAYINTIQSIRFKVEVISKRDWSKREIGYLKLKKFGDDNERLLSRGTDIVTPRHNYKFSLNNIDKQILTQLLSGDSQLGISLHDLNFKAESGNIHEYSKTIKEFYENRNFIYVINGKSIDRFFKMKEESVYDTLSVYDSNLELSENKQIQFLRNVESKLPKFTTYDQIKGEPRGNGLWTMMLHEESPSNVFVYIESDILKKVETFNKVWMHEENNFKELSLSNIENKKILISSQGLIHTPQLKESVSFQQSTVTNPNVCERHRRFDKGECYTKNLKCHFMVKSGSGAKSKSFSESDFTHQFKHNKKNKILHEWYSKKLKTYFMIVEIKQDELFFTKNKSYRGEVKYSEVGVTRLLNCPSQKEHGFRLPGQTYPATRINITPETTIKLKLEGLHSEF